MNDSGLVVAKPNDSYLIQHRKTALQAGHAFDLDGTRLTPFVGLSHDHLRRGAIHERDSAFGLKAEAKSYDQSAALLGLRLQSSPLDWAGGVTTFSGYRATPAGSAWAPTHC